MNAVSDGQQSTDHSDRDPPSVTLVAETSRARYARTQRLTLGEPRDVSVSPDGQPHRVPAQPRRRRPRQLPLGHRRQHRARSGSSPIRPSCSPTTTDQPTTTSRPRSWPGASAPARARPASPRTPPTRPARVAAFALAGRLFVAGLVSWRSTTTRSRRAGVRPAARPHGAPRRVRERATAVHRRARRQLVGARRR